jgi:hypothetical protein
VAVSPDSWRLAADAIATQYIDHSVLRGTALHHDTRGDFNQVVLLPDAMDTRPYRLPWLEGTVMFLLSSGDAHAECKALLRVRTACCAQSDRCRALASTAVTMILLLASPAACSAALAGSSSASEDQARLLATPRHR